MTPPSYTTIKNVVIAGATLVASSFMACSQVEFQAIPRGPCQESGRVCVTDNGVDHFDYVIKTDSEKVDILFVVDTTASMFQIQNGIGQKFLSFFRSLQNLDYHIGITTTDISTTANPPRALNGNGAFQDGRLISMGSGVPYIKKTTTNAESLFLNTIRRNETSQCETYIKNNCDLNQGCQDRAAYSANCVASESAGIHAANLALHNDTNGFFRANVPLSIIIVSNADEKVTGGEWASIPLQTVNQPQTLINTVKSRYQSKPLWVHSIVIPNDSRGQSCYQQQYYSPTVFGWYGRIYSELSRLTQGVIGDICAADYAVELGKIATTIVDQPNSEDLPCRPIADEVQVDFTPAASLTYQLTGPAKTRLEFSSKLPSGTSARLRFKCTKLQ